MQTWEALVHELQLTPDNENIFVGRFHDFPLGLKIVDPQGSGLLLFHVRHPFLADAKELENIAYAAEITRLVEEKQLEISHEDRITWITFLEGASHWADQSVCPTLEKILASFSAAGLATPASVCHYCRQNATEMLRAHRGKAVQICPVCLEQRTAVPQSQFVDASEGVVPLLCFGPLAALLGATAWALVWIGYDKLFEWFKTDTLHIPRLLVIVAITGLGALVGGPVGLVLKRVTRRGRSLSIIVAAVCAVAGVLFGELLYVTWLVHRETQVLNLMLSARILPSLWAETNGFHLLMKLLAGGAGVWVAVAMARPASTKVQI